MKIYKKNKRYRFKEDRLELFFFVNVKMEDIRLDINPTAEDTSVIITVKNVPLPADYNIGTPNRYFSRHL